MMDFCIIWCVVIIFPNIQSTKFLGKCSKIQSVQTENGTINITTYFCCRHFEEVNGTCKACEKGFISERATCLPCDNGRYGWKCTNTCKCNNFERCDHINGCVHVDDSTQTFKDSSQVNPPKTNDRHEDSSYVVVYMSCIAGIGLLIVTVGSVWKFRHEIIRCPKFLEYQHKTTTNTSAENEIITGMTKKEWENHYDDIDEKKMIQFDK